jgi:hypothetical protein
MAKKNDSHNHQDQPANPEQNKGFLPPLDFSSVILPLYTPALIKLGLLGDPITGKTNENLELARRLIDILDLLKDRTKGNLQPEEQEFLQACLSQLKMAYVKKTEAVKS